MENRALDCESSGGSHSQDLEEYLPGPSKPRTYPINVSRGQAKERIPPSSRTNDEESNDSLVYSRRLIPREQKIDDLEDLGLLPLKPPDIHFHPESSQPISWRRACTCQQIFIKRPYSLRSNSTLPSLPAPPNSPNPPSHPNIGQQPVPEAYLPPDIGQQSVPEAYNHSFIGWKHLPEAYLHPYNGQQPVPEAYLHPDIGQQPVPEAYRHTDIGQQPVPEVYRHLRAYLQSFIGQQPVPEAYNHSFIGWKHVPEAYLHPYIGQQPAPEAYLHPDNIQQQFYTLDPVQQAASSPDCRGEMLNGWQTIDGWLDKFALFYKQWICSFSFQYPFHVLLYTWTLATMVMGIFNLFKCPLDFYLPFLMVGVGFIGFTAIIIRLSVIYSAHVRVVREDMWIWVRATEFIVWTLFIFQLTLFNTLSHSFTPGEKLYCQPKYFVINCDLMTLTSFVMYGWIIVNVAKFVNWCIK